MSQLSLEDAFRDRNSICELVGGDPLHAEERAAVVGAIRLAHRMFGEVNVNNVRPLIPTWVNPRVTSATYNALITRKLLVATGEWTSSTDTKGRNVGKPQRIYSWRGELA